MEPKTFANEPWSYGMNTAMPVLHHEGRPSAFQEVLSSPCKSYPPARHCGVNVQHDDRLSAFQRVPSSHLLKGTIVANEPVRYGAMKSTLPATRQEERSPAYQLFPSSSGVAAGNTVTNHLRPYYAVNTAIPVEQPAFQQASSSAYVADDGRQFHQAFEIKQRLQRISSTHAICSICHKKFARPSTLKVHMRIHRGEKPFKCSFCGKCFTQSGNLTTHIRTHTGTRPYLCNVCGKRFTQLSAQKNHMKIHERLQFVESEEH